MARAINPPMTPPMMAGVLEELDDEGAGEDGVMVVAPAVCAAAIEEIEMAFVLVLLPVLDCVTNPLGG